MSKTTAEIHQDMLSNINDDYDKQEGSFIYDATKPAAIELESFYKEKDNVQSKLSIENLSGDELAQRINERTGIKRREATYATTYVTVTGEVGAATTIGDKVSTDTISFTFQEEQTLDANGQASVLVQCDVAGSVGNVPANTITSFPVTIQGLTSVANPNAVVDGYDAENDTDLLERYYEQIQTPATSGNKAHYRNWAKEVSGVGDVKVFPLWNGDNTVKVLIIDSNKLPAPQSLIDEVQNYIDPGVSGLGDGEAPIGAFCTVISATALTLDINFTAVKDTAYTDPEIQANVEANLTSFLQSIAFNETQVSYAKIGASILDSKGILDYSGLTVNGLTSNIPIGADEVAVLGVVTIA